MENSISAVKHSAASGADLIEVDLRLSGDRVPVAVHDADLNRLFNVEKNVSDLSAELLCSFGISTIGEIADYCSGCGIPVILHIKELAEEMIPALEELSSAYGEEIIYGLVSRKDYSRFRESGLTGRILAFIPDKDDYPGWPEPDIEIVRLWENWVSVERVEAVHKMGKEVFVMTGSPGGKTGETDRNRLLEIERCGADGVIVNDPEGIR